MDNFNLDSSIIDYIQNNYNTYQSDELLRSLELLFMYGIINTTESELLNIIMLSDTEEESSIRDMFTKKLHSNIVNTISQQGIELSNNVDLFISNEFSSALFLLQQLNDYNFVITVLDSDESDEEKIASIISHLSTLSIGRILECIESISPHLITAINHLVKSGEIDNENTLEFPLLNKIRLFYKFIGDNNCAGLDLIKNGVDVGLPVDVYLNLYKIEETTNKPTPQMALDILSILIISRDGNTFPLITYRKISNRLPFDLDQLSVLETLMLKINLDFEQYSLEQSNDQSSRGESK